MLLDRKMDRMAKVVVLTLLCSVFAAAQYLPERWKTPYEKSGFVRTPRYAETMDYCRQLEKASPWIKVTSFGKSPEGLGLPLIIASKEKAFLPQQALQSGKAILLIQ